MCTLSSLLSVPLFSPWHVPEPFLPVPASPGHCVSRLLPEERGQGAWLAGVGTGRAKTKVLGWPAVRSPARERVLTRAHRTVRRPRLESGRRSTLAGTHTLTLAVLFVQGQEHFRKWLESLGRHLTGAARSSRLLEVRTGGGALEGPLLQPPLTPELVTNLQHRTHTLSDTPEFPEVHLPKGQERRPPARQVLTPSPLPSPPFRVPPGHQRGKPTCLAPALIGPWCCPSSLSRSS